MAITLTQDNYEKEALQATKPVIIDVFATWCGPCQQMMPLFNELEKELSDKYIFAKINVDEARDLSIQLGVTSVPTFVFIKDKKIVGKQTGYTPKEDFLEKIKTFFG